MGSNKMTDLERLARVIDPIAFAFHPTRDNNESANLRQKAAFKIAREYLIELREPSEGMFEATASADVTDPVANWQAMIDYILENDDE